MNTTTCSTCGNTREWHRQNRPRHRFSSDGGFDTRPEPPSSTSSPRRAPSDPALRLALIDKGVLDPEDLREAERKLELVQSMGEPMIFRLADKRGDGDDGGEVQGEASRAGRG